jgi:flagellar basal body-associated protein FliL
MGKKKKKKKKKKSRRRRKKNLMIMMMMMTIIIIISYRTLSSKMSRELAQDCKDEKNEVILTVMQNKL